MKKTYFAIVLLVSLFFAGCSNQIATDERKKAEAGESIPSVGQKEEQNLSLSSTIANTLQSGAKIGEITKPALGFPSDINESQVKKYFQLGDLRFALVLRSSMNVPLQLPADFIQSFAGMLAARKGESAWEKWLEIKDTNPDSAKSQSSKNNPYYLWVDGERLLLSVVDQNGAGSGEGLMKVFALSEKGLWELDACYYFGGRYSDSERDGDYFAFSSKLSKQDPPQRTLSVCGKDVTLTII